MIKEIIKKNRSYRRFYQNHEIEKQTLINLIDLARLSPSPRNQQALKFMISNKSDMNAKIFKQLAWAGAIKTWSGPEEGERPSAYIIILGDNTIVNDRKSAFHEASYGIAAQSVMLGAVESGLGGCMLAAIKRKALRESLEIPEYLEILLVLALGKPKEKIVIEEMPENGNYDYWRDDNEVHHVPKRSLSEIIL